MTDRFLRFDADAVTVAKRLLGQRLVRFVDGTRTAGTIVEVEAYLGVRDRAAHSFGGRRTERVASMYLPAGHAYVYFTYGMHHCLNVVCGARDEPVAVLIRGLEPTEGLDAMARRRRGAPMAPADLCSGPAKLTQALAIDRELDGVDLRSHEAIWIEAARARALTGSRIGTSPRIGVEYAGTWARRHLRFFVKGSPHVSKVRSASSGRILGVNERSRPI